MLWIILFNFFYWIILINTKPLNRTEFIIISLHTNFQIVILTSI